MSLIESIDRMHQRSASQRRSSSRSPRSSPQIGLSRQAGSPVSPTGSPPPDSPAGSPSQSRSSPGIRVHGKNIVSGESPNVHPTPRAQRNPRSGSPRSQRSETSAASMRHQRHEIVPLLPDDVHERLHLNVR